MAEQPKFTPGPWWAEQDGPRVIILAKVGPLRVSPGTANSEGDAHLIAAAPELYEACRIALKFWNSDHPNDDCEGIEAHEYIKTALAKAEGRNV
jgi:hypothetical protein